MVDGASIRQSIISILKAIGDDPKREGLIDTPDRVSRSYSELFSGVGLDPLDAFTTIFTQEKMGGTVVLEETPFYSFCEHHLLPFYGKCNVAYLPDKRIIGLSKIPRIIDVFSRRLQVQERLTTEIASAIENYLEPKGVGVVMEAHHLCMMMRGVQKQNSQTVTSCMLGRFKTDSKTRNEFLEFLK